MSLISSCTIEYDQTSYWVKCEMEFVGVEDNPITVSVTTPDGKTAPTMKLRQRGPVQQQIPAAFFV